MSDYGLNAEVNNETAAAERKSVNERRKEVENAILGILEENFPDISWAKRYKGFQREKGISGSLVNSRTHFEYDAKTQLVATSTYALIISDPDNTETVDAIADEAFELLNNDDLDGKVTDGLITDILYGAAPNKEEAGSVLMWYEVKYYV